MTYQATEQTALDGADVKAYEASFPLSAAQSERARAVLAGAGIHDSQHLAPFPPYYSRAEGPFKWTLEGRRLIDCWMGHGALLLGHSFPPVIDAIVKQARRGTQLGGATEEVLEWAERVCRLIPSAERVRFTSSGTEATQLAMRVARAWVGRNLIVKLNGHFHGWHDESLAHYVEPSVAGLNPAALENSAVADAVELEYAIEFLEEGEVAAVILEPGGGSSGALPWSREALQTLREETRRHGALLIFDEVVSGFRYSPGGVQALCGVLPDLTVLGKILSGGVPGGAIAGPADIMSVFGTGTSVGERKARVPHTGTFNANPLSAAAGAAMLAHVADGKPQEHAREAARRMVEGVNAAAARCGVDVHLYSNDTSIFHILIGARAAGISLGPSVEVASLHGQKPQLYAALRRALLVEGLDTHPLHGWLSATHDDTEVIELTVGAFERAFQRLRGESGFKAP
jgi:glutamate-1-semialdehyde 2,1-aminomutase